MQVFRITQKKYQSDLSGTGSKIYGGRWNAIGISMLYTSESRSLATLELLTHTKKNLVPPKYVYLNIEIPYKSLSTIRKIDLNELPANWKNYPSPEILRKIAFDNLLSKSKLAIRVPSTIIPAEYNILLNPLHKNFNSIRIKKVEEFDFDKRLLNLTNH